MLGGAKILPCAALYSTVPMHHLRHPRHWHSCNILVICQHVCICAGHGVSHTGSQWTRASTCPSFGCACTGADRMTCLQESSRVAALLGPACEGPAQQDHRPTRPHCGCVQEEGISSTMAGWPWGYKVMCSRAAPVGCTVNQPVPQCSQGNHCNGFLYALLKSPRSSSAHACTSKVGKVSPDARVNGRNTCKLELSTSMDTLDRSRVVFSAS